MDLKHFDPAFVCKPIPGMLKLLVSNVWNVFLYFNFDGATLQIYCKIGEFDQRTTCLHYELPNKYMSHQTMTSIFLQKGGALENCKRGDPEHFGLIRRGLRDIFMFSWGGWRLLGPFLVGAVPFLLAMQTEEIECIWRTQIRYTVAEVTVVS